MDFYKPKQPIALPLDSDDEKLLKDDKSFDPELAVNPPQQESGKRCCFKKGSRGRKVIRRIGHFIVLGAFFYWLWGPSVRFHYGGHESHDIQVPDFTDVDGLLTSVPKDLLWATFDSDEPFECDKYAQWSEPKKIEHPCKGRDHHRHRKPHHPDGPKPPHHPDGPEPPHHRDGSEPPHHPDGPEPPHHPPKPDHPRKPDHPHEPGHPKDPHHPHKPHHPHHPHKPHPHKRPHGPEYTSDATFKLPLSDSALLFYSHGPFASGLITFEQDDSNSLKSDEAEVTLHAKLWEKTALDLAKVCTLKRDHGSGIGIWTEPLKDEKPEERKKHELMLGIHVKFPKNPDPLELEKLQTHMPLFTHWFRDANLKVKDLEVTTFLPVQAEALSVERGQIRTNNNAIAGNYTATDLLVLETRNAPIVVNVTLKNDPEKKFDDEDFYRDDFSKLFIKTANFFVHGNISLHSTAKDHSGGKFLVDAFTTHSPLYVGFAEAPVDSVLHFTGITSMFPAIARMHPTYQGGFSVKSSLFGPKVEVDENVKDPAGKDRIRTVDIDRDGQQITGKVFWGSENENAFGHVELGTTLLRAVLKL